MIRLIKRWFCSTTLFKQVLCMMWIRELTLKNFRITFSAHTLPFRCALADSNAVRCSVCRDCALVDTVCSRLFAHCRQHEIKGLPSRSTVEVHRVKDHAFGVGHPFETDRHFARLHFAQRHTGHHAKAKPQRLRQNHAMRSLAILGQRRDDAPMSSKEAGNAVAVAGYRGRGQCHDGR